MARDQSNAARCRSAKRSASPRSAIPSTASASPASNRGSASSGAEFCRCPVIPEPSWPIDQASEPLWTTSDDDNVRFLKRWSQVRLLPGTLYDTTA
jgi:hypothetical protein